MIKSEGFKVKELCLSGACHRGIAYVGCFEALEKLDLLDKKELNKLVAVSIGSFIGLLYIIGYSPKELLELTLYSDISSFKDICLINNGVAILKGEIFRKWVYDSIAKKMDPMITFEQFYQKSGIHFIISVTCIEDGLVYCDYKNTPNMPIYTGVLASMNFPMVFPPLVYENKRYVDGGLLDNFPTKFLSSKNSLGITVSGPSHDNNIDNLFSYISKLFDLLITNNRILNGINDPDSLANVIQVNASDFSTIDFDMSLDDKITLYRRGYDAIMNNSGIEYKLEDKSELEYKSESEEDETEQNEKEETNNSEIFIDYPVNR